MPHLNFHTLCNWTQVKDHEILNQSFTNNSYLITENKYDNPFKKLYYDHKLSQKTIFRHEMKDKIIGKFTGNGIRDQLFSLIKNIGCYNNRYWFNVYEKVIFRKCIIIVLYQV